MIKYLVPADGLGVFDGLGDTFLDRLGDSHLDGDLQRSRHLGHVVLLGLVFLAAVLVFALIGAIAVLVGRTVTGGTAGGHLHRLGVGLVSHFRGGGGLLGLSRDVVVSANLPGVGGGDLLALGLDLSVAVLVGDDALHGEFNGFGLVGEGGHANLSISHEGDFFYFGT